MTLCMCPQAQIQEQQHLQEVGRLKMAMTALLQEAGERTRREVGERDKLEYWEISI